MDTPSLSHPKSLEDFDLNKLEAIQLGVYRVLLEKKQKFFDLDKFRKRFRTSYDVLSRLIRDIYSLGPMLFVSVVLGELSESLQVVLLLGLQNKILRAIETGLSRGQIRVAAIVRAVGIRLFCVLLCGMMDRWSERNNSILRARVLNHFEYLILQNRLKTDLSTAQSGVHTETGNADVVWNAFTNLVRTSGNLFGVFAQLGFLLRVIKSGHSGIVFACICLAEPLHEMLSSTSLWTKRRIVTSNNADYIRLCVLKEMGNKEFRQDVISGDIVEYILNEYRNANTKLGDVDTDSAESQYQRRSTTDLQRKLVADLPMIYYACMAVFHSGQLSIPTIATLQQTESWFRYSFRMIFYYTGQLSRAISRMELMYAEDLAVTEDQKKSQDGTDEPQLEYPDPIRSVDKGMAMELQNVSFAYPGSSNTTKALDGVSCSIDPGSLVVIVGANGSGKSTIIKLLTRLYTADSGDILVDSQPIQRYRMRDFRRATACLTQDHHLYPLSIGENIGLGYPTSLNDTGTVQRAAKMGGAEAFIAKMSLGLKTELETSAYQYSYVPHDEKDSPLHKEREKLKKTTDVSGGERQRLVASRTFMRFFSGHVKFVAVDEPSSALDPEGELELFNNLREMRSGKTMIFVTHRFGHLTSFADKIICMKNGKIAEQGTHKELMAQGGEYSKLYLIQAKAFSDS